MGKAVPDRWLDYKCHGRVIKNTRIIAFKVPLKFETCRRLLPTDQFTPEMLMKSVPNLKYIIDLTATTRYYKITDFTSLGVTHLKVEVPGQQIPQRSHSMKFFDAMETCMEAAKDDELIGVHCTHGLNRTGFMVCQYLIRQLGWDVAEAIKEFENARGHTIERLPYLEKLKKTPKGEKLITKINRDLINNKTDEHEKVHGESLRSWRTGSQRKLEEESTNWRDHPPPPYPLPMPCHDYSGRSYPRKHWEIQRKFHYGRKNVDNPRELIEISSRRIRQHNIYENPTHVRICSSKVDARRANMLVNDNTSSNIAEKFRKLENTFPIIRN